MELVAAELNIIAQSNPKSSWETINWTMYSKFCGLENQIFYIKQTNAGKKVEKLIYIK